MSLPSQEASAFFSPDFLKFFLPLAGAVVAWFWNERRRRIWEEYLRKEERYRELLKALRGFYVATLNKELKQAFLDQLNQCWLYCPDEVIRKAYFFLATVHVGVGASAGDRDRACGELVAAIRRDMLSRTVVRKTELAGSDFRHFTAT